MEQKTYHEVLQSGTLQSQHGHRMNGPDDDPTEPHVIVVRRGDKLGYNVWVSTHQEFGYHLDLQVHGHLADLGHDRYRYYLFRRGQ